MKQGERWIIFYTDGTTFTSVDGEPWDAPRRSVQCIASYRELNDWYHIHGTDYFYYEEEHGGWNDARDIFSAFDHILRAKYPCLLIGRMLSDEGFAETFKLIKQYCVNNAAFLVGKSDERPPQTYK
jgi:hypothetical protein